MIYKTCARCGKIIQYGASYCRTCEAEVREERDSMIQQQRQRTGKRRYDAKKDTKYAKFYRSPAWRRLSAAYMCKAGYICEGDSPDCQRIATEVHHIMPIQTPEGWDRRFDITNLCALCHKCHDHMHSRFTEKKKFLNNSDVIESLTKNKRGG